MRSPKSCCQNNMCDKIGSYVNINVLSTILQPLFSCTHNPFRIICRLRVRWQTNWGLIPGEEIYLFSLQYPGRFLRPNSGLSKKKQSELEASHSQSSSSKVKMCLRFCFHSPRASMVWYVIKYRDNFIFPSHKLKAICFLVRSIWNSKGIAKARITCYLRLAISSMERVMCQAELIRIIMQTEYR
jgi:hypothetical protein